MKLTELNVSGCGQFRDPVSLVDLSDGLNLLTLRNESGKSTLFKALRAVFLDRHGSSRADIEALRTRDTQLPTWRRGLLN